jgi:hypothetical protein
VSPWTDWFVGGVAISLGVLALGAAVLNDQRAFVLPKLRLLEHSVGRLRARWILGALGVALMIAGTMIGLGYTLNLLGD